MLYVLYEAGMMLACNSVLALFLEINKWIEQSLASAINDWLFSPIVLWRVILAIPKSLWHLHPESMDWPRTTHFPPLLPLFIFKSPYEIKFLVCILFWILALLLLINGDVIPQCGWKRGRGAPCRLWSSHFPLCAHMSCCWGNSRLSGVSTYTLRSHWYICLHLTCGFSYKV